MATRFRSQAAKLTVNGKAPTGSNALGRRVAERVARYSTASGRAQVSTARRVQPLSKREIRSVYNVKSSALGKTMQLDSTKADGGSIVLRASKRRLPLIAFDGTWGGRSTPGATASILLGARRTYNSAFIATARGQRAIFVRERGAGGKRPDRAPVRRLYGPSVFDMLAVSSDAGSPANRIRGRVVSQLESFYVTELARQIRLELARD